MKTPARLHSPARRLARALVAAAVGFAACSDATAPLPVPSAPTGLSGIVDSSTQVTLNWVVPPGAEEIKVQRSTGGAPFAPLAALKPALSSYVDSGLTASTAYRYQVQGCNASGCSGFSEIAVTTPGQSTQNPLQIASPALPPALRGYSYQPRLTSRGGDGSTVSWAVLSGALPPGVSMSGNGIFSGTPTTAGTFPFVVRAAAGAQREDKSFSIRVVTEDTDRFDITRMDVVPLSAGLSTHVDQAIARWQRVLTGDLARDEVSPGSLGFACGGFGPYVGGISIDDIVVVVNVATIDGVGGIQGQASPCTTRSSGSLPVVGVFTLDADDAARLVGQQTLTDIVFHELGHILGFGTLWDRAAFRFQQGPASDPRFVGPEAVREWRALGGVGDPPIEDRGGSGTAFSHWRETSFRTEIMTGFVESAGVRQPLSRVTLASFADLGYRVDYATADEYVLPPATLSLPANRWLADSVPWEEPIPGPIIVLPPPGSGTGRR